MKVALCLIVKGTDQEAEKLSRCLEYCVGYVDKIFITLTQENAKVREVAKFFNAEVSFFEWVNDFAKARNFNFSQVPKEYTHIFWLDADDVPRGIETLKETIEKNPMTDVFIMKYLYAFDEWKNPIVVHYKTRVVKNDKSVEWVGSLHEDFKENRQLKTDLVNHIEILHLSDDNRFEQAKSRNLDIAKFQAEANKEDPRSYWNLGNALKGAGKDKEAIEAFGVFLKTSQSDDEKYIARLRRAESYWTLNDKEKAIDEARYAVGTKPDFPDAYHLLGSLYFETQRYEDARKSILMGLARKPPYYRIIVYNPRDYDYNPLMNLSKVYFNMNLPTLALKCLESCLKICPKNKSLEGLIKELKGETDKFHQTVKIVKDLEKLKDRRTIKRVMAKIPEDLQSEPAICFFRNMTFQKETSTGKDLVIYCGTTAQEWNPEIALKKGIGGSEEAVIHLAEHLADLGWNVSVYNKCGNKEKQYGKVWYKPFWLWNHRDKQDATIIWRQVKPIEYEINCPKIYIDLHDTMGKEEFNEDRLKKITKVFVKSNFHRSLYPNVPDDKIAVISNGIDSKAFSESCNRRDRFLMINTSSPDRSLSALVEIFAEVKKQVPEARLQWAYGWEVFDAVHASNPKIMEWKNNLIKRMKEVGIEDLGKVSHERIIRMNLEANIFLYPTEFAEINCISAIKAQAGGVIPITTDFAALGEIVQFGERLHSEKTKDNWAQPYQFDFSSKERSWFVEKIVWHMKFPQFEADRQKMKKTMAEKYDWEKIGQAWNNILSE